MMTMLTILADSPSAGAGYITIVVLPFCLNPKSLGQNVGGGVFIHVDHLGALHIHSVAILPKPYPPTCNIIAQKYYATTIRIVELKVF